MNPSPTLAPGQSQIDLPVSWTFAHGIGLSLEWLPNRQPLHKTAPPPVHMGLRNPRYDGPMTARHMAESLMVAAQFAEGRKPLEWVACPASMYARVETGKYVISSFIA